MAWSAAMAVVTCTACSAPRYQCTCIMDMFKRPGATPYVDSRRAAEGAGENSIIIVGGANTAAWDIGEEQQQAGDPPAHAGCCFIAASAVAWPLASCMVWPALAAARTIVAQQVPGVRCLSHCTVHSRSCVGASMHTRAPVRGMHPGL